jgi:hypothetical protein
MTRIDCSQVDRFMGRKAGVAGLPEDIRRHLEECRQCGSLYAWMAAEPPCAAVPPEVTSRIANSLAASLGPVRPLASVRASVLQILAVFGILAAAGLLLMGTAGAGRVSGLALFAMPVLLAAGAYACAVSLAWQMRPGSYRPMSIGLLLGVAGAGLLGGMRLLFPWQLSPAFLAEGLPCLLGGLSLALPGAVALWLAVRRGAPLSHRGLGTTLGAAAGLIGVAAVQFQCPYQEASHLMVWHAGALVITTGTGILLGSLTGRRFAA